MRNDPEAGAMVTTGLRGVTLVVANEHCRAQWNALVLVLVLQKVLPVHVDLET